MSATSPTTPLGAQGPRAAAQSQSPQGAGPGRVALAAGAAAAATVGAVQPNPTRMGVTIAAYGMRWGADHPDKFKDEIDLVNHCRTLGAGGVQIGIRAWEAGHMTRLRTALEENGMFLEGQVGWPAREADLPRFEQQIRTGKEAGATIFRVAMLGSRRYETFDDAEAFDAFARRCWEMLVLAERIVGQHKVHLALENHKDWRVEELLDLMRRLQSAHVGICVDTGNSMALLEDPMAVVAAYAPYVLTIHFKDMAVESYADGFLLSEVPLGQGLLDLPRMGQVLRKANPRVRFNLEMITRDPLKVPCLTDRYWATMRSLPAQELARSLAVVRARPPKEPLPQVNNLDAGQRIRFEEKNNAGCFAYARNVLGWG